MQTASTNVPTSVRENKMIEKAQEKVIKSTRWISALTIEKLAQIESSDKSAVVTKWKAAQKIFSVNYLSEELYPVYAFDAQNGYQPAEVLKPIIELFLGKKDSWGIAYWFASANGFLGGKSPQDILEIDPARVLRAALDEVRGITHG
ncbi:MAG: hypothetical protein EOO53_12220 [Gammaproteobacteria bacterium]|nr:MAG: hypothetical protein EOO53_12220 [Gammaproteobacteria bacterium]